MASNVPPLVQLTMLQRLVQSQTAGHSEASASPFGSLRSSAAASVPAPSDTTPAAEQLGDGGKHWGLSRAADCFR